MRRRWATLIVDQFYPVRTAGTPKWPAPLIIPLASPQRRQSLLLCLLLNLNLLSDYYSPPSRSLISARLASDRKAGWLAPSLFDHPEFDGLLSYPASDRRRLEL